MMRQPVRQDSTRKAQHLSRGLASPGQVSIIQDCQLGRYTRLQALRQRGHPGQRRIRYRPAEDLVNHHRDLPGALAIRRAQLTSDTLDSGGRRLPQRTLLRIAEHQSRYRYRQSWPPSPVPRQVQIYRLTSRLHPSPLHDTGFTEGPRF